MDRWFTGVLIGLVGFATGFVLAFWIDHQKLIQLALEYCRH